MSVFNRYSQHLPNRIPHPQVRADLIHEAVVVDAGDAFVAGREADFDEAGGGGEDAEVLFVAQAGEEGLADFALGGCVAGGLGLAGWVGGAVGVALLCAAGGVAG